MTAIDRTAYPRLKVHPSARELTDFFTPTPAEIELARTNARGRGPLLSFLTLL